jgi:hypothetical protein
MMIPASYLYKDVFTRSWGDPRKSESEPLACEPRGPSKGHFIGLIGLLASVLPLATERHRVAKA